MRLLPRDDKDGPRPLRGYGEALRWAIVVTARPFFSGRSLGRVGKGLGGVALYRSLSESDPLDLMFFVWTIGTLLIIAVLLWLTGTTLLFLYAVLQGVVEKGERTGPEA